MGLRSTEHNTMRQPGDATKSMSASRFMWLRNGLRKPSDETVLTRCMAEPGPHRFAARSTSTSRRTTEVYVQDGFK